MNHTYNWIYVDYRNNTWKFSLKDNKKLFYKIMYSEGKWTKEILIAIEVLGFSIYIDENEEIHLVYSNIKGELKYCTMKDKQWVGKTFYKVKSDKFEIRNIKIEMIKSEMNIFYVLLENDGSDHGVLMHCIWNGERINFTSIQDIILTPNLKDYYSIHVNDTYKVDLFFINDEGDEVSLNYSNFENYIWSPTKRLYGIQGEDIGFEVLINKDDLHILNSSKENDIYFLDYVLIDSSGSINDKRVYESKSKLENPILFMEEGKISSCWIKENKIFYSIYNGEEWDVPIYLDRHNEDKLELYNIFSCFNEKEYIKEQKVYGTKGLDLYLFSPNDFFIKDKPLIKYIINDSKSTSIINEKELIENFKFQLSKVNSENKNLKNKINNLNNQVQNSKRSIKGYDEQITRLLDQKRKIEDQYNDLLTKQNDDNRDKENINQELLKEKNKNKIIEVKLNELEEENKKLNKENNDLKEENNILNEAKNLCARDKEKLKEDKMLLNKEKEKIIKINDGLIEEKENLIEEKIVLIEEKIALIKENERLIEELELERNKSVMDILLRRRMN